MNKEDIQKAGALIDKAEQILITTHKSPDGDAIGSSLAMYHYLKQIGKENVFVMVPNEYPSYIAWIEGTDDIVIYEKEATEARKIIRESDLIFSLDYNKLYRTFGMQSALEKSNADFIMIDHHQQPDPYPTVTFSDTLSCSTAQLVYDFIEAFGNEDMVKGPIAEGIYMGIVTDSGSFRFDSVTQKTHEIVGNMIENGLNHSEIHRLIYDTNSLGRIQLTGYALSNKLELLENGNVALITLTMDELKKHNFQSGDTEGLVNYGLSIEGVHIAIFAREGHNQIKLSFRSQAGFNVNEFAKKNFDGGGHKAAAGGAYFDTMDNFKIELNRVLEEYRKDILV